MPSRARRQLLLILTLLTLHMLRFSMVLPFVSLAAKEMGASTVAIGIVGGSFFCLALFFGIPLGRVVDRFGIRIVMIGGGLLGIAQALLLLAADRVELLVLAQLVGGISHQAFIVATQTYNSQLPTVEAREKGFGYQGLCVSLGLSAGPLLGGVLVQHLGHTANFAVALALSFPALSLLVLPADGSGDGPSRPRPSSGRREIGGLVGDPRIRAVLVLAFFMMIVVSLRHTFLPVYLEERMFSEVQVGFLIASIPIVSVVVRFFFGRILGRFSRRAVAAYSVLALAVGSGAIPLFGRIDLLLPLLVLYGTGFALSQPLTMVMIADQAPPQNAGLAMGLRFTVITLANAAGPILLGWVGQGLGLAAAFYGASLMLLTVAAYLLVVNPGWIPQRGAD